MNLVFVASDLPSICRKTLQIGLGQENPRFLDKLTPQGGTRRNDKHRGLDFLVYDNRNIVNICRTWLEFLANVDEKSVKQLSRPIR